MPTRQQIALLAALMWVCPACAQSQNRKTWTELSLGTCNVNTFLADHPKSDGRGVVVAVLDTGVDPSIPGLTQTPDGEIKVIDLRDFSGQGDVDLHRVRLDAETGKLINYDDEGVPIAYTLPDLPEGPAGEERRFWFGFFEEKKFANSEVSDINDNGETTDRFPICVTAFEGDGDDNAVCFVDTNLDRSFADEKPLENYHLRYDTFTFARRRPESEIRPLTFSVNIFLRQEKISLFFDDGAHGTHVAGIAAGYRINNQDGFNGVAPGAKVIGLKIASNAIGGLSTTGAKKKALAFAARFAREHGVQVVCNLSFGVESTIEGDSDIDNLLNEKLHENPYVVFCTSAGNSGPGLSTVGTPSSGAALISVGALLAADTARDQQGYTLNGPVPTLFTSRGGELPKPDLATPGWSTSTVPRYVQNGDFWAGTSMASPYAAGLSALLISDALSRDANAQLRACDVKRALCLSAHPLEDATPLDIGAGVPNISKAAEILQRLQKSAASDPVQGYKISTPSPSGHDGATPAAYWRSTWFPTEKPQVFTIEPIFMPVTDAAERTGFTRKFDIRSQTPWCKPVQESVYLHSEQEAEVNVGYDASMLTDPGLHVGVVEALHDGLVAFRMLNTIIVPYTFDPANEFTRVWNDRTVHGWRPDRYFAAVPAGASAMKVTLSAPADQRSSASIQRIFDPRGYQLRSRSNKLDADSGRREVEWSVVDKLIPGVWELDVVGDRPDRNEPYDLRVRFFGLHSEQDTIREWDESPSEPPSGDLTITNQFARPLLARASGKLEGFRMEKDDKFKGLKSELSYKVNVAENIGSIRVTVELAREDFAQTTDLGIELQDAYGEDIIETAMNTERESATVKLPNPGEAATFTLRLTAGFALPDDQRETPVNVKVDQLLDAPIDVDVERGGESSIDFAPGVPIDVQYSLDERLPAIPEGQRPVGYLVFQERGSNETALKVPMDIGD
jgi:tripeptidyl-peptidase-2